MSEPLCQCGHDTPNPLYPVDGTKLTPAELARLSQAVETDDGTGHIYAVAYAVEGILSARLADLMAGAPTLADAWDEGSQRGWNVGWRHEPLPIEDNPYRVPVDTEGNQ